MSATWPGILPIGILLIGVVLIGAAILFAAEIGLDLVWRELWSLGRRRSKGPRFPWSDRTGQ